MWGVQEDQAHVCEMYSAPYLFFHWACRPLTWCCPALREHARASCSPSLVCGDGKSWHGKDVCWRHDACLEWVGTHCVQSHQVAWASDDCHHCVLAMPDHSGALVRILAHIQHIETSKEITKRQANHPSITLVRPKQCSGNVWMMFCESVGNVLGMV